MKIASPYGIIVVIAANVLLNGHPFRDPVNQLDPVTHDRTIGNDETNSIQGTPSGIVRHIHPTEVTKGFIMFLIGTFVLGAVILVALQLLRATCIPNKKPVSGRFWFNVLQNGSNLQRRTRLRRRNSLNKIRSRALRRRPLKWQSPESSDVECRSPTCARNSFTFQHSSEVPTFSTDSDDGKKPTDTLLKKYIVSRKRTSNDNDRNSVYYRTPELWGDGL